MRWTRRLSALLLLAGCATPPTSTAPRAVLWPMPPELPRYIHEGSLRSLANVMPDDDAARLRRLLAGPGAETEEVLAKPLAVAARAGRVFVTDTVKRRIVVFDNPRRKVFEFGLRPPGELVKPRGIAVDAQRRVYVADSGRRQVVVYDDLGLYSHTVGDGTHLEHPSGVAANADGSRVYVVDRGSNESDQHRIQVFDAAGRHIRQIGMRGDAPGRFNIPVQAAVGPDGRLYVLDAGNFRVQVFSPEGEHLHAFGQAGSGLGQFSRPRGLAVDARGAVYVSDAGFANVQVFDERGRLLLPLGERGLEGGPGRFVLPGGIAADETGRVFVVDQYLRKIEVFRALDEAEGRRLAAAG